MHLMTPSSLALATPSPRIRDSHWAFRGSLTIEADAEVRIRLCGASWFEARLDGNFLIEGPVRFDRNFPEFEERTISCRAGRHVLAVHLHDMGLTTRLIQEDVPGFLWVEISVGEEIVPLTWRRERLKGFKATGRRIHCVLGWSEWCDSRQDPEGWDKTDFDDSAWTDVSPGPVEVGLMRPANVGAVEYEDRPLKAMESGTLVNMSIIDHDPPMAFVNRVLDERDFSGLPPGGIWKRFDLGRVMLGRAAVTLDVPAGATVQVAYSESLTHGRVFPYLKSGGGPDSCPLDTWFARGGRQTFHPLSPKGGRFLEIHVLAEPETIKWIDCHFVERSYFCREPEGTFACSDPKLDRIWKVGVDTLRSCCEDAVIDNPARERGQWLGDAVGPGMDILAVSYADQRVLRRGLIQAAQCAAESGMIPAIFPGTREYLPTFSLQWVPAILRYFRATGDSALLQQLYPAAVANLKAFDQDRVKGGLLRNPKYWNFVDWGYSGSATVFNEGQRDEATIEPALSLFYLSALKGLSSWAAKVDRPDEAKSWAREAQVLLEEIEEGFGDRFDPKLGFHVATLALREGIFQGHDAAACVERIKAHILSCFPNDPTAPRLEDFRVESHRLITPFFMNFALPVLIEHGEVDFVLDQFRTCWGWMLDQGVTTWFEVFDPRWSHCHQWSGCPTWILSRYVLGMTPRSDRGVDHYDFLPAPGKLEWASGLVPSAAGLISVAWRKSNEKTLDCRITAPTKIFVLMPAGNTVPIEGTWEGRIALQETKTLRPAALPEGAAL